MQKQKIMLSTLGKERCAMSRSSLSIATRTEIMKRTASHGEALMLDHSPTTTRLCKLGTHRVKPEHVVVVDGACPCWQVNCIVTQSMAASILYYVPQLVCMLAIEYHIHQPHLQFSDKDTELRALRLGARKTNTPMVMKPPKM